MVFVAVKHETIISVGFHPFYCSLLWFRGARLTAGTIDCRPIWHFGPIFPCMQVLMQVLLNAYTVDCMHVWMQVLLNGWLTDWLTLSGIELTTCSVPSECRYCWMRTRLTGCTFGHSYVQTVRTVECFTSPRPRKIKYNTKLTRFLKCSPEISWDPHRILFVKCKPCWEPQRFALFERLIVIPTTWGYEVRWTDRSEGSNYT